MNTINHHPTDRTRCMAEIFYWAANYAAAGQAMSARHALRKAAETYQPRPLPEETSHALRAAYGLMQELYGKAIYKDFYYRSMGRVMVMYPSEQQRLALSLLFLHQYVVSEMFGAGDENPQIVTPRNTEGFIVWPRPVAPDEEEEAGL